MSEFDKEAEREKLREKYAAEEQKRQATQRMSELLLRGATMTNQHCETCGDPLFRYEGQVFCPTCQSGQGGAAAEAGAGDGSGQGAASQEDATASDSSAPAAGPAADSPSTTDGSAESSRTAPEDATTAGAQPPDPPTDGRPVRNPATESEHQQPSDRPDQGHRRSAPWPDRPPAHADLPALRETDPGDAPTELEAVVARLARRAAATEDPTQAREWLAAAREAAEALAALRSSGQR